MSGILENWDNGDWGVSKVGLNEGVDSFEKCEDACRKDKHCVQWNWRGRDEKQCVLAQAFRYGEARGPEERDKKWVDFKSGWLEDRIDKWRKERQCKVAQWVTPSIPRVF
jgi:hypothetical protein